MEITVDELQKTFTDITAPEHVEVLIRKDHKVVWVNVNGVCVFRACKIKELDINNNN